MSTVVLRDYQIESVEGLREGVRAGHKKQVLVAPTGAGKTEIACHMLHEAKQKLSRALFIVDRVVLVDQTSQRLDQYGIPHGVIQSGHWRMRPAERIQVCSAQTLESRGIPDDVDVIFVDEAHCMRKKVTQFLQAFKGVVIGLTATPFTKGMGKVYSSLVNITTLDELVRRGFLVPLKMYAAKAIDTKGMKVVAGEWSEKEIEARGLEIIGDIVSEWQSKTELHFGGPVKTIVFSATVDHGEELCRQFQAAGYNFQQISYRDSNEQRRRDQIEEFRKSDSEIMGLVSCEVFTKGFDVADVLCGISARPYRKSLSSHMQQLGRLMRAAPGKGFGLWLDHSGNCMRFRKDVLQISAHGVSELDDGKLESRVRSEPKPKEREEIRCSCGYMVMPWDTVCHGCGKVRKRQSMVEHLPGVMQEVTGADGTPVKPWQKDKQAVWTQLCAYALGKYNGDAVAANKLALAKFRQIYGAWPKGDFMPAEAVSTELRGWLKNDLIKYSRRKAA